MLVKGLLFGAHCGGTVVVYILILLRLQARGVCKRHDKCTKVSLQTISIGLVSMVSWCPTFVRASMDTPDSDINLVMASQPVFYINPISDPLIYILAEKILSYVPCLNTWRKSPPNMTVMTPMVSMKSNKVTEK